jgi:RimJ/RimL family protein N-acetyltransferase
MPGLGPSPSRAVIETPRLTLRPVTEADAEALHACFGDPEVMRYWDMAPRRDVAHTREWIAGSVSADPRWHAAWSLVLAGDDRPAGFVNYHHRAPRDRRLEIGYMLARAYWGQGLMSEAVRAFVSHCFEALDTHRVEALVEPDNAASIRLVERLGFRREGLLRDRLLVQGTYRSVHMFAVLEDEWRHGAVGR